MDWNDAIRAAGHLRARYPNDGEIHQLWRFIITTQPTQPRPDACPKCGASVPRQTGPGRPRKYCTDCSPQKTPGKAMV